MSTEIVMPQMGESIAEGTITKWMKKVGDRVERDEPLFEISTDKVDAEIPSPAAGTLTEIRFQEGDTVEINKVVAMLDGNSGGTVRKSESTVVESKRSGEDTVAIGEREDHSETVAQPFKAPQPEKPASPPPPAIVPSSTLKTAAESTLALAKPTQTPPVRKALIPSSSSSALAATETVEDLRRAKSSPLVRNIAREHGINISHLEGTGLSGRVTKNDILSYIESSASTAPAEEFQPASAASTERQSQTTPQTLISLPLRTDTGDRVEQMSVVRKKIAEHMVLSRRTSAHVTTVYEIDMSAIARLREKNKAAFMERTGTKLTFMPFIFQATTIALRKFPVFNAQVNGDQILYKRDINLGMAVALDWGLIVPVIKRADDLSISGLARAANDLADRARGRQLKPDEVGGGTFTITNPGVFGGLFGTPIINQPQLAILGIGAIEKRPRVMPGVDGEDYIAIRSMAYFALSFDHRVIDGADAERFLAFIKELLEAGKFSV